MLKDWLSAIGSVLLLMYFKTATMFASVLLFFLEVLVTYALYSFVEAGEGVFAFDVVPQWLIMYANHAILYLSMLGLGVGIFAMLGYALYLALKKRGEWMEIEAGRPYRVMAFQFCMVVLFADWAFWVASVLVLPGNQELIGTVIAVAMVPMIALFAWKAVDPLGYIRLERGHFESVRVI
jgi:hypothetical protein